MRANASQNSVRHDTLPAVCGKVLKYRDHMRRVRGCKHRRLCLTIHYNLSYPVNISPRFTRGYENRCCDVFEANVTLPPLCHVLLYEKRDIARKKSLKKETLSRAYKLSVSAKIRASMHRGEA